VLAGVALTGVLHYLVTYGSSGGPPVTAYVPVALRQNLLPWTALVGLVAAVEARRRYVQARIEREHLRAQVAEQRLVALTGQLHPHFLFNTLQGISTLIHRDPNAADEMLGKLADLLREVLRHREHVLVPLGDEIRYARMLLEIAQRRFADRLSVSVTVPNETLDASVPLFILQPLIENALAHGIGQYALGAFDAGAIDYLHKPVTPERFELAVTRARERLQLPAAREQLVAEAARAERTRGRRTRFVVRRGNEHYFVPVDDVDWMNVADNYVRLHVGARAHLTRGDVEPGGAGAGSRPVSARPPFGDCRPEPRRRAAQPKGGRLRHRAARWPATAEQSAIRRARPCALALVSAARCAARPPRPIDSATGSWSAR
jgi:hypothetical protein